MILGRSVPQAFVEHVQLLLQAGPRMMRVEWVADGFFKTAWWH